ncbi:MAG: DUF1595 domain-containing protein, partial [Verrucomicrobiota bacterium]
MRKLVFIISFLLLATVCGADGDRALLEKHCAQCHNEEKAKGKFRLGYLGDRPGTDSLEYWLDSLDYVVAEEMPPEDESTLTVDQRKRLIAYLEEMLEGFEIARGGESVQEPRRLNNREFENSVRDVLLLEDIGTNLPTDNLIGECLFHGFDTHGQTLGFSRFHLEQYLGAVRKVVDATILAGGRPESRRIEIDSESMYSEHHRQNSTRPHRRGKRSGFDFLDPRQLGYFEDFNIVPETGYYRVKIQATGLDRGVYSSEDTGIHHGDPIRLNVQMGDREKSFDLPDGELVEIELEEWMAAGTRFRLRYPTDGLKMRGNGNFKFQYAIGGYHIKNTDPRKWEEIVATLKPTPSGRMRTPESWHNWTDYWQGARPRVLKAEVEGPYFKAWPPVRQMALLGRNPSIEKAQEILKPIAERAWRRPVLEGELDRVVELVQSKAGELGVVEALKEGIVAILVSPAFLLLNGEELTAKQQFASKFSSFLQSTLPDHRLRRLAATGGLDSFGEVKTELERLIENGKASSFLREFPFGWLELNDINFMAPDPDN